MKRYVSPKSCCRSTSRFSDLRLDRDVERRDRLVGDDELRLQDERARDADALALAARELVRVAAAACSARRPTRSSSSATRASRSFGALEPVDRERLADESRDGHARVERRERSPGR